MSPSFQHSLPAQPPGKPAGETEMWPAPASQRRARKGELGVERQRLDKEDSEQLSCEAGSKPSYLVVELSIQGNDEGRAWSSGYKQ